MQHERRWTVLVNLANRHGWMRGVEVGVLMCQTFEQLLIQCKDLHMIGVDPLTPQPIDVFDDDGTRYRNHNWQDYQNKMVSVLGKYKTRATWLRMRSEAAAAHVDDGSQDFVFIDADHATAAVQLDIRLWLPKIKSTGWLTGHDTHFPTVRCVLDAWLPGWVQHDDNVWSIPKRQVDANRFVL